jgi:hypothetical protein
MAATVANARAGVFVLATSQASPKPTTMQMTDVDDA